MTEREVQRDVVRLYQSVGCAVYNLAQGYRPGGKRHGTTRQSKGLPDLYVFPPRGTPFWMEVKTPTGKQSPKQATFQRRCDAQGVDYVLGGVEDAVAHLQARGILRRTA